MWVDRRSKSSGKPNSRNKSQRVKNTPSSSYEAIPTYIATILTSSGDGLHARGGTLPIPSDFEDFLRHFSATWSSSGSYTKSPQEEQYTLPRVVSTDRRWPLEMAKMLKLN